MVDKLSNFRTIKSVWFLFYWKVKSSPMRNYITQNYK